MEWFLSIGSKQSKKQATGEAAFTRKKRIVFYVRGLKNQNENRTILLIENDFAGENREWFFGALGWECRFTPLLRGPRRPNAATAHYLPQNKVITTKAVDRKRITFYSRLK
jgi:hypothetical protein